MTEHKIYRVGIYHRTTRSLFDIQDAHKSLVKLVNLPAQLIRSKVVGLIPISDYDVFLCSMLLNIFSSLSDREARGLIRDCD